jgi:Carboxymuconolactone decarboxylase family
VLCRSPHLRYHTSLTAAETELAICTSARASNADYIWNGHVRLGLQAGTREEALHAVDTHGPAKVTGRTRFAADVDLPVGPENS